MKVITWNIGEDLDFDDHRLRESSYEKVVDVINDKSIDVICLQEAITSSLNLPSIGEYIEEHTDLKNVREFELSSSHINTDDKMGIVIASKYKIDDYEEFKLENPGLELVNSSGVVEKCHDKGFIIARIGHVTFVTGHGFPFRAFKENPIDHMDKYSSLDDRLVELYRDDDRVVLCGDFNYEYPNDMFPKFMHYGVDVLNCSTFKGHNLDHFILTKAFDVKNVEVVDTNFDHKYGLVECDIFVKST